MRSSVIAILVICAFGLFSSAFAQLPPRVFGNLPEIADAAVSPDGKTVALQENIGDSTVVRFFDLATGEISNGMRVGKVKARGIQWASNTKLLLLASQTNTLNTADGLESIEFWRYAAIDKNTGDTIFLLNRGDVKLYTDAGQILHMLPEDPGNILMVKRDPNLSRQSGSTSSRIGLSNSGGTQDTSTLNIYRVSLKTGIGRSVLSGNTNTIDWIVDSKGAPALRIDISSQTNIKKIFKVVGKRDFDEMGSMDTTSAKNVVFHAVTDSNSAIVTATGRKDKVGAYTYNLSSNAISDVLYESTEYDLDNVEVANGRVNALNFFADRPEQIYFDDVDKKVVSNLGSALTGARIEIVSKSMEGGVFLVLAHYTDRPPAYYLFENDTRSLSVLGPTYPSLNQTNSGEREKYDYTTEDGFFIRGYLTRPSSADKNKKLPLIVLPHGGPEARDDLEFNWWASAYAAQGYAVYQPNFRGSDGYGRRFRVAGWGEWGRKMQDDISDGVRKLAADGVVYPDKVCIVGASYGGYAALAGATLTPDLYKCAVSVNGVSDLVRMLGTEAISNEFSGEYWERRIGSRFRDIAEIEAVSPSRLAQNVRVPILLIHGRDDTVVPYSQSTLMNEALEKSGKSVEFVTLNKEDHWLSTGETRIRMLEESIKFLDAHLKN